MSADLGKGAARARLGVRPAPRVRHAQASDAACISRVFVDCWKEGYHGVVPTAYAARLSYEEQAEAWRRVIGLPGNLSLVALSPAGEVVGFLCGGPERSGSTCYFAEIYGLYVLPEFRGQAAGRRLLQRCCREMMAIGLRSLTVRVVEANPIRGFYEALGGVELGMFAVRVAGRSLNEVAYGWRDILALGRGESPGKSR